MTLISKLAALASSPQARKAIDKASAEAGKPANRAKLEALRNRVSKKGGPR
jgi:hypothetical protein